MNPSDTRDPSPGKHPGKPNDRDHNNNHDQDNQAEALALSVRLENLLVGQNLRGMRAVQAALEPGYLLRAARLVLASGKRILICTGFPVLHTFETDGPVGAMALCHTLQQMKYSPQIVSEPALAAALFEQYPVLAVPIGDAGDTVIETLLAEQPDLLFSIERPGAASDGHYYNMRAEDISARVARLDAFIERNECPSIGIGDGGNEIGMGNVETALQELDITPSVTRCSELIPADVSNWGALGLIAMLGWLQQRDLLADIRPLELLAYIARRGSLDGVSRRNELTEDGLPGKIGVALQLELRQLTGFC